MAKIYDVDTNLLIEKAAEELKKVDGITPPEWANYVKTGVHKQRTPVNKGWWYIRAAAVLRSVYKLGPIGVSKLRTKYGGKKNRGVKPEEFRKGSGNIIRKILRQLEKAGFVIYKKDGIHKGRIITPKGKSFLDKIAVQISKTTKKEVVARKPAKEEKEKIEKKVKEAPKKDIKIADSKKMVKNGKIQTPKQEEKVN